MMVKHSIQEQGDNKVASIIAYYHKKSPKTKQVSAVNLLNRFGDSKFYMLLDRCYSFRMNRLPAFVFIFFVSAFFTIDAKGENLIALLESSIVRVEQVNGNGASSGTSLEGILVNTSESAFEIDTALSKPLYFKNQGSGQNMLATALVGRSGGYYSRGSRTFIEIGRKETKQIAFVAYCADFDRDNPTRFDSFLLGNIPNNMTEIANQLRDHEETTFGKTSNSTVALQVALWLAQGVPAHKIRDRFPFTFNDELIARQILQNLR